MIKTLSCIKPGSLDYRNAEMPELTGDNAIIKIKRIGICGTDLHAYEGTQPFFSYPRVLGHELAGTLLNSQHSPGWKDGEPVTFIPYFNCGQCIACRRGLPNCCVNIKVFGVHIDGGMAEYVSVPADKLLYGQGLSFDELALVEPLAIGAHAIRRANVQTEEFVLIMGAGPIGLSTMEFVKIAGGKVIALDVNEDRLQFCMDKLSVEFTVNPAVENAVEKIKDITNNDMATVVIDATGNLKAINNGINYLAHGGRYVLVGLQKDDFHFNHPEFHKRETALMSSRNAIRADFEYVIECMKKGFLDPTKFITHRVNFKDVKTEFESWLKPTNGLIKAMVNMEDE